MLCRVLLSAAGDEDLKETKKSLHSCAGNDVRIFIRNIAKMLQFLRPQTSYRGFAPGPHQGTFIFQIPLIACSVLPLTLATARSVNYNPVFYNCQCMHGAG
jgi:hypothetical protein